MRIEPFVLMTIIGYGYILVICLAYMYVKNRENLKHNTRLQKRFQQFDKQVTRQPVEVVIKRYIKKVNPRSHTEQLEMIVLIGRYKIETPIAMNYLFDQLASTSPLVRLNALTVIVQGGKVEVVVDALEVLQQITVEWRGLINTLEYFPGHREVLYEAIVKVMNGWSQEAQVAIIEFLGCMEVDTLKEEMLTIVTDRAVGMELRASAIKYFQTVKAKEALPVFVALMQEDAWELRALTAKVLKNYETVETRTILVEQMSDPNWYVRYNSAMSLLAYEDTTNEQQYILEGEDRYAKEILHYVVAKRRMEEGMENV